MNYMEELSKMNRRLLEAARIGDTDELATLLGSNPDILEDITITSHDTPLHIASKRGHLAFVQEVIRLEPKLATELNQQGFSPLHLASANGHLEIVKELLKLGDDLCLVRDRDARIPLHLAAIKGREGVLKELISSCRGSAEKLTARQETVLHLALKNNQCGAFKVLVEELKMLDLVELINKKDDDGNTVLHLAASRKQHETLELLLSNDATINGVIVQVNTTNESGFTALDVSLQSPSELGDQEINEILRGAGATRPRDVDGNITTPPPQQSPRRHIRATFSSMLLQWPLEMRNVQLVVLALIATTTFQAAGNPPQYFLPEYFKHNSSTETVGLKYHFSRVVAGPERLPPIFYFMTWNTTGFIVSIGSIVILILPLPLRDLLLFAVVATVICYGLSMAKTMPVFVVICGSSHVPSSWFVWLGALALVFSAVVLKLVMVSLGCFTRVVWNKFKTFRGRPEPFRLCYVLVRC